MFFHQQQQLYVNMLIFRFLVIDSMIFKSFCPTILISVEAHTQAVLFLIIICQKKKQLYIKTKTTENYVFDRIYHFNQQKYTKNTL